MKGKLLDDLEIYQLAMSVGEDTWQLIISWGYFEKNTLGKQLINAVDSIAVNIAEGYGRYFFKENKQFLYYSRGSLIETKTWIVKAKSRNLISNEQGELLINKLSLLHFKLNAYIKSIGPTND